jgi:5-(carboxyamino)imidazole ribonucleotide synthase
MAARNPPARCAVFPRRAIIMRIRYWRGACLPAGVPAELESRAEALAAEIIARLGLEGLLCVEMFVTKQGELLVNELAPRPHNSYHQSERGCVTSQFEQLVRTTCNLAAGRHIADYAMRDCEPAGRGLAGTPNGEPNFAAALAVPGVRLHLYEKHAPRVGRKMGHLSAWARRRKRRWSGCWRRSGGSRAFSHRLGRGWPAESSCAGAATWA